MEILNQNVCVLFLKNLDQKGKVVLLLENQALIPLAFTFQNWNVANWFWDGKPC